MCIFQFLLTFCPHIKEQHCYRKKRFHVLKYTKNAFAAVTPPRTPLRELTALPQTPYLDLGKGGGGKGKGGEEERRGK